MLIGNTILLSDKITKAVVVKEISNQSCIIEGEKNRIHFIKLVEYEDIREGKVNFVDWGYFF